MSTDAQRRLILHMSVSLDGFSAVGNGAPDWRAVEGPPGLDHGGARHQANVDLVSQMGMIVIGRGAYEDMVRAWPGTDSPMGRLMNTLPKVVFSDSLTDLHWENARLNEQRRRLHRWHRGPHPAARLGLKPHSRQSFPLMSWKES